MSACALIDQAVADLLGALIELDGKHSCKDLALQFCAKFPHVALTEGVARLPVWNQFCAHFGWNVLQVCLRSPLWPARFLVGAGLFCTFAKERPVQPPLVSPMRSR